MPTTEPRITAEITFLRAEEGGRQTAPRFPDYWFLHVVIQDRSIREARIGQGWLKGVAIQEIKESYHPLRIVEAPTTYELGNPARFVLTPMYYPQHPFPEFTEGVTFTAREGPKVVAHGVVLSREEPAAR